VIGWLAWVTAGVSLVLGVWCLVAAGRGVRPSLHQLIGAAVLEALLVAQAVIGVVLLLRSGEGVDTITFLGYHLTAVTLLPVGVGWGIADRSRWGNGVFAIAAATEAVLVMRLVQIWNAGG
jgi:hypothetical protein